MGISWRELKNLQKPVHGGVNLQELRLLGLTPGEVIDFSANINPWGPPPRVREVLAELALSAYPDPECRELREAISRVTGVDPRQIVPGNGSTELIHLLARACLREGDIVVILAPTYGEYEIACRLAGAKVILIQAEEEKGFQWNISEACRKIRRLRPRLAFLCNPNNPTGIYLEQAAVEELATAMGEGWLILDEAYISFVEEAWQATSLLGLGKVVCLRSLTKDYALTALRLGYALCPPEVATTLFLYQPCWSVNAAAQAAGIAALSQPEHLFRWRRYIAESKSYLERELQELGYKVSPSAANFLLAEVGDAVALRARLLSRGICVRDCSSFGLPRYIRIAARSIPDSERLVRALKEVGK